jgi:protease-4
MWRFSIISDIMRGTWAIEPRYALSLAPTMRALLNKEPLEFIAREKMAMLVLDDNGNKLMMSSDDESASPYDNAPKGSIALIPLHGTMRKYGSLSSYGTEEIALMMMQAVDHPNIDAVILDVDSGGGSIDSIHPMLEAIDYSQRNGKPVVSFADLCASAAYYVSCKTDSIIASNEISAEFGSIGVMVSFADMRGLYEKDGVKFHTVYAPESTHKNLPFENALKGEYDSLKNDVLSPIAKQFQDTVKKNRKGSLDTGAEGILNGKMFYAKDALKVGLIDKIGNLDVAVKQAKKLAISYSLTKKS